MAITTIDDIVSGLTTQQYLPFFKALTAAKAVGAFQSAWMAPGFPGAGSAPPAYTAGSGYTCDDTTAGAFPYVNASVQNWLARVSAGGSLAGSLILADRLWSCSGMGYAATTYTITTPGSLPARITDNGVGCEMAIEQFAAAGAASGTMTVSYKDASDTTCSGVIPAVVSAPVSGQIQLVPQQVGKTSIKNIISCTNSATWTSGSFGITIFKRIAEVPVPASGLSSSFDWASVGLPKIPSDACLWMFFLATSTTATNICGSLSIIDK